MVNRGDRYSECLEFFECMFTEDFAKQETAKCERAGRSGVWWILNLSCNQIVECVLNAQEWISDESWRQNNLRGSSSGSSRRRCVSVNGRSDNSRCSRWLGKDGMWTRARRASWAFRCRCDRRLHHRPLTDNRSICWQFGCPLEVCKWDRIWLGRRVLFHLPCR